MAGCKELKAYRKNVMYDTIEIFKWRAYLNIDNKLTKIHYQDIQDPIKGTRKYSKKKATKLFKKYNSSHKYDPHDLTEPCILVVRDDCLEVALQFFKVGFNPVVLNMASAHHPGGGYKYGAGAQEESLHRRSMLHLCLDGNRYKLYPIPKDGAIYTPNALVVKHSEANHYISTKYPYPISFISSAAINCKQKDIIEFDGNKILTDKSTKLTKNKIETIFEVAIINNHDVIVLSAFGCGAFNNPPHGISKLFKDAIDKYKVHFKYIVFAIFNDKNGGGNVEIFSEVLGCDAIDFYKFIELVSS